MSKRALRTYIKGLKKSALEDQIIDLYERFREVKTFYDFAFNPKEDELLEAAKAKILKEYFPQTRRKPKARRSIAQQSIKTFTTLEMDPGMIADLMLYNLEIAQAYAAERYPKQMAFYISMHKSFKEAIAQIFVHGLSGEFQSRLSKIAREARVQNWPNAERFEESFSAATFAQ